MSCPSCGWSELVGGGAAVPFFDPNDAGVDARILILLDSPGRRTAGAKGSKFISADNNGETASNMWGERDTGVSAIEPASPMNLPLALTAVWGLVCLTWPVQKAFQCSGRKGRCSRGQSAGTRALAVWFRRTREVK